MPRYALYEPNRRLGVHHPCRHRRDRGRRRDLGVRQRPAGPRRRGRRGHGVGVRGGESERARPCRCRPARHGARLVEHEPRGARGTSGVSGRGRHARRRRHAGGRGRHAQQGLERLGRSRWPWRRSPSATTCRTNGLRGPCGTPHDLPTAKTPCCCGRWPYMPPHRRSGRCCPRSGRYATSSSPPSCTTAWRTASAWNRPPSTACHPTRSTRSRSFVDRFEDELGSGVPGELRGVAGAPKPHERRASVGEAVRPAPCAPRRPEARARRARRLGARADTPALGPARRRARGRKDGARPRGPRPPGEPSRSSSRRPRRRSTPGRSTSASSRAG